MASFGWYRSKVAGFEYPKEAQRWDELLRDSVFPFLLRLDESGAIVRFFFLNEPGSKNGTIPNYTMIVFFGQIDEVMEELKRSNLYDHLVRTGPADHPLYEDYDLEGRQAGRFGSHYMLGIAVFELGSRFAIASRLGQKPKDAHSEILLALRHAFCLGLLMPVVPHGDPLCPVLDPLLDKVYAILTNQYPEAWMMRP